MRFKLDENLGSWCKEPFIKNGLDVMTVYEQNLTSSPDESLIQVCRQEDRCIVTLDLDFANPFVYPPQNYSGIAVLRLPKKATKDDIIVCIERLITKISTTPIIGKLWIIDSKSIREYQPNPEV